MASIQHKNLGFIVATVGWVLVVLLTLYPTPDKIAAADDTSLWCLVCGDLGLVDVVLNTVLFVPFGIGLGLLGVSRTRALAAIVLTTLTIEVLQLGVVVGRDASLSDLITNSGGGLLGFLLAHQWRRVFFTSPRVSLWLAMLGAIGWLAVQGFSGWALQRTLPSSIYYGQWAPALGQFEQFTGEVLSARVDSIPLPSTRFASSAAVREALLSNRSMLQIEALTGTLTRDVAPIFSIFDDRQREILLLGQDGDDLVYRVRTRTASLGLRGPVLRLSDVLPAEPGAPLEITAHYTPGRYRLEVGIGDRSVSRELRLSVSWGWSFLLPFDHAFGAEMPWLTILWIAGLLFPVGYYPARSGALSGKTAIGALVILLFLGLVVIPVLSALSFFHPLEWIAGIVGAAGGWQLGKRSATELRASCRETASVGFST
ncbi:MAG: VanZ family protein [Gammaproteobacteria bacterium]